MEPYPAKRGIFAVRPSARVAVSIRLPFYSAVLHPAFKYASVFLLSTVKFLGGPLAGASMGLHFWQTLALTVAGMMTSVFVFSGVGRVWMQHRQKQRRLRREPIFSKKSRNIIKVFRKFGMGGIAFLTPVLLSPIGGTVIATLLGVPRQRILLHMFLSALFWGSAMTLASIHFGHLIHHK
jgi:uncharacterized membrane protein